MKKSILIFSLLAVSLGIFAQKSYSVMGWKISKEKKHALNELKVNLPMTIFASYPEITYERILDTDISVGASLGVGFNSDISPMNVAFTPFFRWFFGGNHKSMERAGAGFFIEANGSVYSQTVESYSYIGSDTPSHEASKVGAGLGFAVGWKYLSINNWIGEINAGLGKDFVENKYDVKYYPRLGISIGKRF